MTWRPMHIFSDEIIFISLREHHLFSFASSKLIFFVETLLLIWAKLRESDCQKFRKL
jgi:hypothetical protein